MTGGVTFRLEAYRGNKRVAKTTREVRPAHATAVLHLTLSSSELKASKISASAAAARARGVTILFKG